MTTLIALEIEKVLRRRLNQVVLAVSLSLLILVYVLLWMASDVLAQAGAAGGEGVQELRSALYLEETIPFAVLMLYLFGFVAGVVVVGANVGAEYTWNTMRTLTAAEPRRGRVLLAKLIALWVTILAGMLVAMAVMLATSAVITISAGEFDLSFVDAAYLGDSAGSFGKVLVATSPYLHLAFLFGVIGKSPTAGIALALGVAFLEGIIGGLMVLAGGWLEEIPRFMLDHNGDALAVSGEGPLSGLLGQEGAFAGVFERPDVAHSVTVLLAWAAFFLALTFWSFRRQDLEYQGG